MNSENDFSNNLTPKYCYVRSKNIAKISPPRASGSSAKVGPCTHLLYTPLTLFATLSLLLTLSVQI